MSFTWLPKKYWPVSALLLLLLPGQAMAIDSSNELVDGYFRVIWGLLLVLGIMLLLYGLLRKRFSLTSVGQNQRIKILEIRPLMPKKAICLVEVNGEEHLLGIGTESVTHLAKLSGKSTSFSQVLDSVQGAGDEE